MSSKLHLVAFMGLIVMSSSFVLDEKNYDESTAGKQVFIKFYAPWCGHCQAIAPAWKTLMEEHKDSKTALVAEVDCTVEEKLCETHKIEGFPTIKYGDPKSLQDYEGERELGDLQKFAKEKLGPVCGPKNLDLCDEEQKKLISEAQAMSAEDIQKTLDAKNEKLTKLEEEYVKKQERLQAEYELLREEHEKSKKAVKEEGNKFLETACAEKEGCTVPEPPKEAEHSDKDFDLPPQGEDEDFGEDEEGEGEADEGASDEAEGDEFNDEMPEEDGKAEDL